MNFDEINLNIEKEKKILSELLSIYEKEEMDEVNKDKSYSEFLKKFAISLINQIEIINESIAFSVDKINFLDNQNEKTNLKKTKKNSEQIRKDSERIETSSGPIFIKKSKKEEILKQLKLEKGLFKKIKSQNLFSEKEKIKKDSSEIEPPSDLAKISNHLFRDVSMKLSKKSVFINMDKNLKKANLQYRTITYISITLFLTLITLIFSIGTSFFFGIENLLRNFFIALIITILVFFVMFLMPSQKAESNRKKIENEIPFAVSNMASIASSEIEPTKIFSILALSKEFPQFSQECKKIVNQVNFYGYDLNTALKNVAKNTASTKFGELLNGISTNATSGGNLSIYLQEKSKDYMLDYKLSREKYANTLGVYSDIYTALLIAAPLLFMLLLVVISIIGSSIGGMSLQFLSIVGIISIVVINILFLLFLELTQPEL